MSGPPRSDAPSEPLNPTPLSMTEVALLRLTPRDGSEDEAKFKEALAKLDGSYLVVREFANREHLHAVVYSQHALPKVRRTFYNTLGKVGNGVISMKRCPDPVGVIRYICKGENSHPEPRGDPPEVVCREGLWTSDECIRKAYDEYWALSQKCKDSKGLSFTNKIMFYMEHRQIEFTQEAVCKAVVDHLMMDKQALNDYYIMGVTRMIMAKKSGSYKQDYIQSLVTRLNAS